MQESMPKCIEITTIQWMNKNNPLQIHDNIKFNDRCYIISHYVNFIIMQSMKNKKAYPHERFNQKHK